MAGQRGAAQGAGAAELTPVAYRPGSGISKAFHHMWELCSPKPVAERVDMSGRKVIVTGATPGSIGYQVARTLAAWGADVTVTCPRDSDAAREALFRDLRDAGRQPHGIEAHRLDLADAGSVADFAAWYRETSGGRLDVLINNAGILRDVLWRWREQRLSADGFEIHWRTNYLGTFHLTRLLLPMLLESGRRSGDARVVNVSSHQHDKGSNDRFFAPPDRLDSWTAYGQSKLALIHHAFALQRRYGADGNLRSAALHPGSAYSNMTFGWQDEPLWLRRTKRLFTPLAPLILLTPNQAAQTTIHCATDPHLEGGHYHERCAKAEPIPDARDEAASRRLWEETDRWVRSLGQE
ncbi:MAG: SDR family NAD(P)-dependent oxidoreductase [Holophagales bacterium]|nr:SDR family NAD(P)-dependent oxidoreductase [Holophagales bacterium]MYG32357.1 SDR family NAD(P)-dependent oxidoreductase [Holophagales bacterium]MYI78475.1 SDR family NAD(P)-dependent oxidoreductase [Holophagales bacterium]